MIYRVIHRHAAEAGIPDKRTFVAALTGRGVHPKTARRLWDGHHQGAILTVLRICRGLGIAGADFWAGLPAAITSKLAADGVTTDQAAERIGISGRSLRDYARGATGETACRTIRALLAVLVIPLHELLSVVDPQTADP